MGVDDDDIDDTIRFFSLFKATGEATFDFFFFSPILRDLKNLIYASSKLSSTSSSLTAQSERALKQPSLLSPFASEKDPFAMQAALAHSAGWCSASAHGTDGKTS